MQIRIDHVFTSLNPYIDAERINRFKAAQIKREETFIATSFAAASMVKPISAYPVDVVFMWHCSNTRTDPDNIAFAQKFILDGIVKAGILQNDRWKEIGSLKHEFILDEADYVIVDMTSRSRYKVDGE